jgi:hypothetical protein
MVLQLLTWPLDSLIWIAEQVEERASEELAEKENLHKRLTNLQLRFDLGEVSEADFVEQEQEILEALEAEWQEAQAEKDQEKKIQMDKEQEGME